MVTASALYVGQVRHRRSRPHAHTFNYRIGQLLLDLDELPQLFEGRWLWSYERANLASFRRSDFLGDPAQPLKAAVLDRVQAATGERPAGPVRMLAHLRYFGFCMNPVSFYYCYESDATTLHSIVAEITNTPWNERHAYVLPAAQATRRGTDARIYAWEFDKLFHVSPFLPMGLRYDWRFERPGDDLRVHMDVADVDGCLFDATLTLKRRALSGAVLARFLLAYPAQTVWVALRIYWNALLIKLKRNPFYAHPRQP